MTMALYSDPITVGNDEGTQFAGHIKQWWATQVQEVACPYHP